MQRAQFTPTANLTPIQLIDGVAHAHAAMSHVIEGLGETLRTPHDDQLRVLLSELLLIETRNYSAEDALMRALIYDRVAEHRAEHTAMLINLATAVQMLARRDASRDTPGIVAHLEALRHHHLGTDERLSRFLRRSVCYKESKIFS